MDAFVSHQPTNNQVQTPVDKSQNPSGKFKSFSRFYKKKVFLILPVLIVLLLIGVGLLFNRKFSFDKLAENNIFKIGAIITKSAEKVNYFSVVSISPDNYSKDNNSNTPITITFSEPVKPGSLRSYFTESPMIPGTFTQGDSPNKVVFTAKYPYGNGISVKVILNKGFESVSGDKFMADYTYNFYTKTPDDSVSFENNSIYSRWTSLAIGKSITFNMDVGNSVAKDSTITVYKGTFDQIVSSLLYHNNSNVGTNYVDQTFINYPVDTAKMEKVTQTKGVTDGSKFIFKQGEGLYYIEAKSNDKVVGSTWINVTNEGLIIRQDDQKILIATQNISTSDTNTPVKILLYNLQDKPTLISATQINNFGEIPVQYPQTVDLVVGQTQNGVVLAPVNIPQTQADIRVTSDLSKLDKIYVTTDKPTYLSGETVKFSGVLREDNDAKYTLSNSGSSVKIWAQDPNAPTKNSIDQTVTVDSHGIFSGQFVIPDSLIPNSNTVSPSITLYAKEIKDGASYFSSKSLTTFDVVSQKDNAIVNVSFDKQKYFKNDTVMAHISVTDTSGKPLENQVVNYTVYTKDYFENDPTSVASFGRDFGEQTTDGTKKVTLDGNGKADVALSRMDSTVSQAVTLEATISTNGQNATGAKTVLVQQGNAILAFGPSRQEYQSGDTTTSRVYATDLQGKPLANTNLQYQVYSSAYQSSSHQYKETNLYQGNVTTDQNGYALISQKVTSKPQSVTLRVIAIDDSGNAVQAERTLTISDQVNNATIYYHDLVLTNLDVATDKLKYDVGDTANLTITSPFDQNVLITQESGRIYKSEWIKLHQGDNSYAIPITTDLTPSFNVVFSYFSGENLFVEGLPITVTDSTKTLKVNITTDKNSYSKSDTAQVTITTKDNNGNPVKANVLVDAIDDNIFGLRDVLPSGDIGWYYYKPREDIITSSASTLGIGTGGGCGGGSGFDTSYVPNHLGNTVYWSTSLSTDQNGQVTISVPLTNANGNVRMYLNAVTDSTAVSQTQSLISVK